MEEHGEARLQSVVVKGAIVEEARLHELIRLAGGIPGAAEGEGNLCALEEKTGERDEQGKRVASNLCQRY